MDFQFASEADLRASAARFRSLLRIILSVWLAIVAWYFLVRCGPTYYARGFTEVRFDALRVGMSEAEVTAIIGPPLGTRSNADGVTLWTYSDREYDTCDFEMRWVYFRGGHVETIVDQHWDD